MVELTQISRRLLPTNCLSVSDHLVGLALTGKGYIMPFSKLNLSWKNGEKPPGISRELLEFEFQKRVAFLLMFTGFLHYLLQKTEQWKHWYKVV